MVPKDVLEYISARRRLSDTNVNHRLWPPQKIPFAKPTSEVAARQATLAVPAEVPLAAPSATAPAGVLSKSADQGLVAFLSRRRLNIVQTECAGAGAPSDTRHVLKRPSDIS